MQQDIFKTLGFSLHYEDCKGDFAHAQQLLDSWKAVAEADPSLAFQLHFWQAMIHFLTGTLYQMEASLDQCQEIAGDNIHQQLIVATYRALLTHERYNTFANGSGVGTTEISARWRGAKDLMEPDAIWRQLKAQATDANTNFEAWYVYAIVCTLRPSRYNADKNRYKSAGMNWQEIVGGFIEQLQDLFQQAQQVNNHSFAAYLGWAAADLYRWTGELTLAQTALAKARQAAVTANDQLMILFCDMALLDWQCAPCGNPLSWNLAIQDSSSAGSTLILETEQLEMVPLPEGTYENCFQAYQQLGKQAEALGLARLLGNIYLRQGYLKTTRGDYQAAAAYAVQAFAQFEKVDDHKACQLATLHRMLALLGQNQTAELEEIATSIGKWGKENGCLSFTLGLGILVNRFARQLLLRQGDYEKAIAGYKLARALFLALDARINAAQNRVDIGLILKAVGQNESANHQVGEAIEEYQHILEEYPKQYRNGKDSVTNLRQRIIFLSSDAYQLALRELDADGMQRNAERIKVQIADIPNPEDNLESLVAKFGNQFSGTEDDGETGLSMMDLWPLRFLGQTMIEQAAVLVPVYRAKAARRAGDWQALVYHLRQAEKALGESQSGNRDFLATLYWAEKEDWDEAAVCYQRYVEGGLGKTDITGTMGQLMDAMGNTSTEEALADQRNLQQAFTMWIQLRQFEKARDTYQQLETRHGKDWWQGEEDPWSTLRDLAEIEENIGAPEKALSLYQEAIRLLENRRRQLSQDNLKTALSGTRAVKSLYHNAVHVAFTLKNYDLAFQLAEESKARGLLDLMAGSLQHFSINNAHGDKLRQWRQLNAQLTLWQGLIAQEHTRQNSSPERIADYRHRIETDEAALNQLEKTLQDNRIGIHELASTEGKVLDVAAVAAFLDEESVLVEYLYSSEYLYIFAIDQTGVVGALMGSIDAYELEPQIAAFHQACRFGISVVDVAEPLSKLLLQPLEQLSKTYKKWYLVPYGKCHSLPFHALSWKGKLLSESVRLSYLPSASALQFLEKIQLPPSPQLLAFGNPTGDLKAAEVEVAWVASLFGQQPLLGTDATEAHVRQHIGGADILHFATHGYLSEKSPLESALAMEPGETLTLYELMGLQIKAELAVLSACNTAQGETTGGDDVLGLSRGLLTAGVKAAIVSLWEVDDVATSLFMRHFYQHIKDGAPPAEALHEAQQYLRKLTPKEIDAALKNMGEALTATSIERSLLTRSKRGLILEEEDVRGEDYSHPFYWAPFVLVGR